MDMGGGCRLVPMTVQAVHRGVIGVHNDHLHRGAGGRRRIDIAGGVMAGSATAEVGGQDIRPVQDRVAVGAWLGVGLAAISGRVELNAMVDGAAG